MEDNKIGKHVILTKDGEVEIAIYKNDKIYF